MAERGELALDDELLTHLRDAELAPSGRPITLRDLATHVSALPSMPTNFDLTAGPNPYEAYSIDELRRFLATYDLPRSPGERWQYSNLGVSVLGHALASRAGISYERLLAERVLEPLGMQSSSITLTAELERRLAPGHDMYLHAVEDWELPTLPASGALRSTANDLLNLVEAYLGYRKTNLEHAMTAQLAYRRPVNGAISQALGWGVMQIGAEEIVLHDGGKAGYRSFVAFNSRTRTGVVVLSNTRSRGRLEGLALHMLTGRPLRDSPQPPARTAVQASDAELEACAGEFQLESAEILDVVRNGSRLLVQFRGSGVGEFVAQGPRTFFSNADDVQLEFKSEHDRIVGLVVREGSRETAAVRVR